MNMKHSAAATKWVGLALGLVFTPLAWATPVPVATYNFNGTLSADESGVPDLTPLDPLGSNQFQTENVFGTNRTVYRFDGNNTPVNEQAGLVLPAGSLLDGDDAYSVEVIFRFDVNSSTWENIFGVSNRKSDNAFYVAPSGGLQVWPVTAGPDPVTQNEWHHVTLTNDGTNVIGYLDGVFQFNLASTSMNFSRYTAENPDRLIHFFADNVVGGGQGEFADGAVSLIRLYDIALTGEQVANLPLSTVSAPPTWMLLSVGMGLFVGLRRRGSR